MIYFNSPIARRITSVVLMLKLGFGPYPRKISLLWSVMDQAWLVEVKRVRVIPEVGG